MWRLKVMLKDEIKKNSQGRLDTQFGIVRVFFFIYSLHGGGGGSSEYINLITHNINRKQECKQENATAGNINQDIQPEYISYHRIRRISQTHRWRVQNIL